MNINIEEIIKSSLIEERLIYGVFTKPRNKSQNPYKKITFRPVNLKNEKAIQLEKYTETQVFHENIPYNSSHDLIVNLIVNDYQSINIFNDDADFQIMVSKKGNIRILKKLPTKKLQSQNHNKQKKYIINEYELCDFLIRLGVMNKEGKVFSKKYDKFKQINKFLEIVDDLLKDKKLKDDFMIIDFGCGKAYLTFALYYYFYKIRKINVKIIGMDLKKDVINYCNDVSNQLGYDNLKFIHGDICDFDYDKKVDMIVTLHACDTATDAALVKAIKWKTDMILSVPCCQHEFFNKIHNESLEPMLKHGLIKERISSLVTDSLRCLFLETHGYKVQMMEFIDMEHTPKNILIRAVKSCKNESDAKEEYKRFKEFWKLDDLFIEKYYEGQMNLYR